MRAEVRCGRRWELEPELETVSAGLERGLGTRALFCLTRPVTGRIAAPVHELLSGAASLASLLTPTKVSASLGMLWVAFRVTRYAERRCAGVNSGAGVGSGAGATGVG